MADKDVTQDSTFETNTAPSGALDRLLLMRNSDSLITDITPNELARIINPSGWIEVADAWTYASASTITIPSDGTTKYQRWMKIRLKQGGGYKYYVASVVASTLITVLVNEFYTVANAAITDIAYSFTEKPYAWPDTLAMRDVASSSGSAVFSLDASAGATISLANNATATPGGNANNFSGILFAVDTTVDGTAGCYLLCAASYSELMGGVTSTWSNTKDTASKINIYFESGVITIQNKTGVTRVLVVMMMRARNG